MRLLVLFTVLASTGCALRARYRDFVTANTDAKQVVVRVSDVGGAPMSGAKIELSEWKNRLSLTSAADGTFALPVEKKYLDENPVLVVQVPAGQRGYSLAVAPPPPPPAPATPPEPSPPPEPSAPPSPPTTGPLEPPPSVSTPQGTTP